jgi:hypothetical protein
MDMPNGPGSPNSNERHQVWRSARRAELFKQHPGEGDGAIGQPDVLEGNGFLYRPRQILFETGSTPSQQQIEEKLRGKDGVPDDELNRGFEKSKLRRDCRLLGKRRHRLALIQDQVRQVTG